MEYINKMKRKQKYFKNKMNNQDYYGDAPIRTKYEYMAQGFLIEAGIPFHINQVFCFSCNKFYSFESREMPDKCAFCKITFKGIDKGCISRPDYILDFNDGKIDLKKIGILRIDGAVHDRIKATRISDYYIWQAFKERGIKVFIIRNETFLELTVKELREIFQGIKVCMLSNDAYDRYARSKEFEELTYCGDIQRGKKSSSKSR